MSCCCWRNLLEEISFCKKLWRKDLLGRVFGIAACCCCCLDRMVVAVMVAGGQSGARMVPHLAKRAKESQRETRVVPLIIPQKEHLYLYSIRIKTSYSIVLYSYSSYCTLFTSRQWRQSQYWFSPISKHSLLFSILSKFWDDIFYFFMDSKILQYLYNQPFCRQRGTLFEYSERERESESSRECTCTEGNLAELCQGLPLAPKSSASSSKHSLSSAPAIGLS